MISDEHRPKNRISRIERIHTGVLRLIQIIQFYRLILHLDLKVERMDRFQIYRLSSRSWCLNKIYLSKKKKKPFNYNVEIKKARAGEFENSIEPNRKCDNGRLKCSIRRISLVTVVKIIPNAHIFCRTSVEKRISLR